MKHYKIPDGQHEDFYDAVDELINHYYEKDARVVEHMVNKCCRLCDGEACAECKVYEIGEAKDTYATSPVMGGKNIYYVNGKYYYTAHQGG